jgi:hypothetical protein
MDEPIDGHVGAKLMKEVTVELCTDGWSKTVKITVPADDETTDGIERAVQKFLRDAGKDECVDWA